MSIRDEIIASCEALFCTQQVVELRALEIQGMGNFKHNAAGWFNSWPLLADHAERIVKKNPSGVYVTLNPLHPACIARTENQLVERAKDSSSDRDVVARRWLPIDLDPVRPAGVSASDEELGHAREKMKAIVDYLEGSLGFAPGLKAFSGNGIHLLYKINLENTPEAKDLLKGVLASLAERFDDDKIHVDKTMFNAARIIKLWGTPARKGRHTEERPHRQSTLWTRVKFDDVLHVSNTKLQSACGTETLFAGAAPAAVTASGEAPAAKSGITRKKSAPIEFKFDLDEFMQRNNIIPSRSEEFDGSGVRHILPACLFDETHRRSSAILGRAPTGSIFYKCQHASCADKDWKAVKELYPAPQRKKKAAAAGQEKEGVEAGDEGESPWMLATEFIDHEFAADIHGSVTLRRHRETFYIYEHSEHAYRAVSDDYMRVKITRWLGERGASNTRRTMSDVMNSVCSLVTVSERLEMPFRTTIDPETHCAQADPIPHNWVTLRNGILDVDAILGGAEISKCLRNHSTEWFSTTTLPFNFPDEPEQTRIDKWLSFLNEVLEGDEERIGIIQEMFGYCFWRNNRLEKFFILQGRGSNGKSTVLDVLSMLLGQENITNLSLDQLIDPILRYDLYQKVANICSDLPEMERIEEGVIKRVTSGEPIVCNRKYKDSVKFAPTAKLIFSTNPLPRFKDATMGIWRRMMLIPFNYSVPPEDIDIHLKTKLMDELPGILMWALEGAARLAEQHAFSASKVCDDAHFSYRMSCFPVLTFLEECTTAGGSVRTEDLWRTYKRWCVKFGLNKTIKAMHPFVRDAINFRPNVQYPRVSHTMAGEITLTGIQLKENLIIDNDERAENVRPYW